MLKFQLKPKKHQLGPFQERRERLQGQQQLRQEQCPLEQQHRERQLLEEIKTEADYQFDPKATILKSYSDCKGVFNCLQSLHCVNYILLSGLFIQCSAQKLLFHKQI